jgi:hypothetical protein
VRLAENPATPAPAADKHVVVELHAEAGYAPAEQNGSISRRPSLVDVNCKLHDPMNDS